MWVQSLGLKYPLEQKMATHSSILAWKISCTEKPGRLQSMKESDTAEQLSIHTHTIKTTMRYHLASIRMATMKNNPENKK